MNVTAATTATGGNVGHVLGEERSGEAVPVAVGAHRVTGIASSLRF
jgi:hypothetical protein